MYLQPTINLKLAILTFAGTGLSRVLGISFVFKFHLILPVWETLETGYKPVPAKKVICFFVMVFYLYLKSLFFRN